MPGPVAATRIVSALLSFAEICSRNKRYILVIQNQIKSNHKFDSPHEATLKVNVNGYLVREINKFEPNF